MSVSIREVPKVLRPAVLEAVGRGWRLNRTRNRHLRLLWPGGGIVVLGGSPSDHRALAHLRADLRRTERNQ